MQIIRFTVTKHSPKTQNLIWNYRSSAQSGLSCPHKKKRPQNKKGTNKRRSSFLQRKLFAIYAKSLVKLGRDEYFDSGQRKDVFLTYRVEQSLKKNSISKPLNAMF